MNFLAHAYLSFNHPDILVGNMISDFVKGRKKFDYSLAIQKGIQLHRAIDAFTDVHAATHEAKKVFKPVVGLYAGAFVDVVYDHFLATDSNELREEKLQSFATNTYQTLDVYNALLPANFAMLLPYMRKQNWLYNYKFNQGIANSFEGLVRRAKFLEQSTPAYIVFEKEYAYLQSCYQDFFPDVKTFAISQLKELLNTH